MSDLKPITAAKIAELRALAEKATPGERIVALCDGTHYVASCGGDPILGIAGEPTDSAFVRSRAEADVRLAAALDRETVLRFCDTVEAMLGMLAELHADVTDALRDDHNSGAADGVLLGFPRERITRLAALLKEE